MLAWLVMFVGFMTYLISLLGWTGVLIVSIALAFTAAWVTIVIVTTERRVRRRMKQVESTHPGWGVASAVTTEGQADALRAAGNRQVLAVGVTVAYGPTGIELWAPRKHHALVKVLELPWAQIAEIRAADDVRNLRGWPVTGLRITLVDGRTHDLIASPQPALAKTARATKTPLVAALANDINTRRTTPAWPAPTS
jgi:hypothetical protein